ncbi:DUF2778 domain-containing protein [Dickeya chrysanthemi]|uniref:DUF2778 domain-containing protein n=1 Tax=Dickeya chrysanthemi TaxID=556 RepID=A0ABU8JL71_DICCH|nr:DUF2778 domain-containing protein [Dickeya chrysanthemi]MCA7009236.1 DUF2778 domain-containing protein [Dickeya chrysanthemi]
MALQGKFIVNNADYSPLTLLGVGTFMAFSGDEIYRNRGGCTAVPEAGPIPEGRYWIVDRPTGGIRSQSWTWLKDQWNTITGTPSNHSEWFGLYRHDGQIDDYTWINGVRRGNFRLHPVGGRGISLGCITLRHYSDFATIRAALLRTKKQSIHNTGLEAYGIIEVVAHGNTCP